VHWCLVACVVLVTAILSADPACAGRDWNTVPGLMGPNALPTLPVEDAAVGDDVLVELAGTAQFDDLVRTDSAFAPYFLFVVPFRQVAAIEFDGTPVEFWQTSAEVATARGAVHTRGTARGDLRVGAKFVLFRETEILPVFSARFLLKTATGKSFEDRRFTAGPAYFFDALASKTLLEDDVGFFRKVRVLAQLGFVAWQQGTAAQDDAISFGAAVQTVLANRLQLEIQARGYIGWQEFDKPVVAGVTATYPFDFLRIFLTLNRGITMDAPKWEVRTGLIFFFEIPYLSRQVATPASAAGHSSVPIDAG
jgi:hypothetical protein